MNNKSIQKAIVISLIVVLSMFTTIIISKSIMSGRFDANVSFLAVAKKTGWQKINGKWYYYNNGNITRGWKKINNIWYYFASNGVMQTGWQKISGKWYYLDANGKMLTGWQVLRYKVDTDTYYFDSNGAMVTGLRRLKRGAYENLYYFSTVITKIFHEGAMATGLQKVNGSWYYFDSSGRAIVNSCTTIEDSRVFCFDAYGRGTNKSTTPTYSRLKSLGTITVDVKKPIIKVGKYGTCTGPQGFTVAGNYYVAATVDSVRDISCVSIYSRSDNKRKMLFTVNKLFGHTNDMTYIPRTDEVYVGLRDSKFKLTDVLNKKSSWQRVSIYDENRNINYMSGIAYDPYNANIYTANTNYVYVYNSNFKLKNYFRKVDSDTTQGIGAYRGKILVLRGNSVSTVNNSDINTTSNSLDIYRMNGDYLGSYILYASGLEIESISYTGSGNKFAIYTGPGSVGGQIFEININIPE